MSQFLTALPVFNEDKHVQDVLDQVRRHTDNVLVVDDGSTDSTACILKERAAQRGDITVIHHETNLGYGAALPLPLHMHSNLVKTVRIGTVW